ncbi:MAG: DUF1501 domain-containing protein [Planctomycetota bacterium]|nr:DUF1501 domain-containing protein [Planctomycetota bacterium]
MNNKNQLHNTRRRMIQSMVGGSLLIPAIVQDLMAAEAAPIDPLAPRAPHFPGKAKRVIYIYLSGGMSHVDTFNYRPKLFADNGKEMGKSFVRRPNWEFKPYGQCGMMISDIFPHVGSVADELCLINSMATFTPCHTAATLGLHTGSTTVARPSLGAWVSYGLGTENQNLPSFVVLADKMPYHGAEVWGAEFLPACHQGTRVIPGSDEPIANVRRRLPAEELQAAELELIGSLNQQHLLGRERDPQLAARIRSFETAAGMQLEAPETYDLSKESDATLELYGLKRETKGGFAWQAIVARRMAERGVRFIEVIDKGSDTASNWDNHSEMAKHGPLAKEVDQPIAALIKDLKSRGMLNDTLVVITTEFGRTPTVTKGDKNGRGHHSRCYSSILVGGGTKAGITYGTPDDYGIEVAEDRVHAHDFNATILHLLGFDHERLTYRHAGLDFRLTGVDPCHVVKGVLA